MARCMLVYQRNQKYFRIPDAEVEDWDEVREELDAEPKLIERVEGWARTPTPSGCRTARCTSSRKPRTGRPSTRHPVP